MLKRKKQLLLAKTIDYTKESQIPLNYDPDAEVWVDSDLIPTPPDPPIRECVLNNKIKNAALTNGNGHRGKENGYGQEVNELKQPPLENGYGPIEPESEEPQVPSEPCELEWCKKGCVCQSIGKKGKRQAATQHCGTSGDPDCIFGCICHQVDPGERKKFRLRWSKVNLPRDKNNKTEDDDCGFIPPGSQISLAHNEDGRPKRKSQPPERFRHGFDLNKVTLDKNFSAGSSFRSNGTAGGSNGYCNGNAGSKRNPLAPSNGLRSASSTRRDRDRNHPKSSTIKMLANGSIQKTRIIVGNPNRFAASSKFRSTTQFKKGPTHLQQSSKQNPKSSKHRASIGALLNPCEDHNHDSINFDSIITGLALRVKCDSGESGDGVLINRNGTVVAVVSWTTDGYMRPTVSRLRYKREHSRSRSSSPQKKPPANHGQIETAVQSAEEQQTEESPPPVEVEVHDSDLSILCLPSEEESKTILNGPCSSRAAAQASLPIQITSHYRFFDLPSTYHESSFVLYPELHAVFAVNALQAKIKSIRGAGAKARDPKIVELNSINLNQPTDPIKKGNVHLLIDAKHLIVMGTIPPAFRNRPALSLKDQQERSPLRGSGIGIGNRTSHSP